MNICIVGKYPPIEGVVSAETYWQARGLASRGHRVHVITNAEEVEPQWRMRITAVEYAGAQYAWECPELGGYVRVISSRASDPTKEYHIPNTDLSTTRTAAMTADIIREKRCEIIYAHYLEPYGVAAHMVSGWTGVPYIIKHAGTDVFRLTQSPTLRTTYTEVLRSARRVISAPGVISHLMELGVSPDQIEGRVGYGIPTPHFGPDTLPLDPTEFASPSGDELTAPLVPGWPILGIYGKLAEAKGSFDLLRAIAELVRHDFPLHLVSLAHGSQEQRFRALIRDLALVPYVRIWPFLPPWRIPSFIRLCSAVAILENGFEIPAHVPVTPREVVACASCLIVSEEVARKQPFCTHIRNGRNAVVIRYPRLHSKLASTLRHVLENPSVPVAIGKAGYRELDLGCSWGEMIDVLEKVLYESSDEGRASSSMVVRKRGKESGVAYFRRAFPLTDSFLSYTQRTSLFDALRSWEAHFGETHQDGDSLVARIRQCLSEIETGNLLAEIVRYEHTATTWRAKWRAAPVGRSHELDAISGIDRMLVPRIVSQYEIMTVHADLRTLVANSRQDGEGSHRTIKRGETVVLFSTYAAPMILGSGVLELFRLIERGDLRVEQIEQILSASKNGMNSRAPGWLAPLLERLFWASIIAFDNTAEGMHSGNPI